MREVRITGWRDGLLKISLTKLIQAHTGLGLSEAKRNTDRLLEGGTLVFRFEDERQAGCFVEEVVAIGAIAEILEEREK